MITSSPTIAACKAVVRYGLSIRIFGRKKWSRLSDAHPKIYHSVLCNIRITGVHILIDFLAVTGNADLIVAFRQFRP